MAADRTWWIRTTWLGRRTGLTWWWTRMMPSWKEWYDLLIQFKVFERVWRFFLMQLSCCVWLPGDSARRSRWREPDPGARHACRVSASKDCRVQLESQGHLSFFFNFIYFPTQGVDDILVTLKSAVCFCDIHCFYFLIRVQALVAVLRCSVCFMPRTLRGRSWNSRRKLTTPTHLLFPRSLSNLMRLKLFRHVRQLLFNRNPLFVFFPFTFSWLFPKL